MALLTTGKNSILVLETIENLFVNIFIDKKQPQLRLVLVQSSVQAENKFERQVQDIQARFHAPVDHSKDCRHQKNLDCLMLAIKE